ncbi:hypothetical protein HZC08_01185 [Candidatus Micrarchaeota archaeon]|nr:hypothetical protein [Candidatus Micrarchaeota archaeon]
MAELVKRRSLRNYALLGAAALLFAGAGALTAHRLFKPKEVPLPVNLSSPTPRVWCFREKPTPDSLTVYTESLSKSRKGTQIGSAATLKLPNPESSLASACDLAGNLWWVTSTSVFKGKIINGSVEDITQIDHTRAPEYRFPGTKVISADLMWLEGEERPYIITLTNTGYFQAFRLPTKDFGIRENFIIRLSAPDMPECEIWPLKNAVVGVIDANHFSVIPLQSKPIFIQITFPGSKYKKGQITTVETSDIRLRDPSVKTIESVQPVVWDETRGGLATIVTFMHNDGNSIQLPILVKFED